MGIMRCLMAVGIGTALVVATASQASAQSRHTIAVQKQPKSSTAPVDGAASVGQSPASEANPDPKAVDPAAIADLLTVTDSLLLKLAAQPSSPVSVSQSPPLQPTSNEANPDPKAVDPAAISDLLTVSDGLMLKLAAQPGESTPVTDAPPAPAVTDSPPITSQVAADLAPLNPNPNPLFLPAQADQITIDITRPLTLQQCLELARRNNRTLQVAELQLRQSRAALKQALAAQFPTLSLQSSISRTVSGSDTLDPAAIQLQQQQQLQTQQQQQLQQQLLTQQTQAQQTLQTQIRRLQELFQGAQLTSLSDQQNQELQQQISQLQQSAATAATPSQFSPIVLSPLTLPTPSFGIGSLGSGSSTTGGSSLRTTTENAFNGSLSLRYNLYTSGQRDASIKASRQQVRLSELEVQRQTEQLQLDVSNDYYNAQQAEIQVRIAQAAVNNAQVSLRDTAAQERAGLGTRFDVLQAQVTLANAQQNLTQARNLQVTSRQQLAQRLSLNDQAELTLADPVAVAGTWTMDLGQSIVLALSNRVELAQFIARRNIAIQNRRIALSSLGPQLTAFANLNTFDRFFDDASLQYGYSVGMQVSFSLYDGGSARANAAQQTESIAIAETNFANTKDQIRFQVEEAYISLQSNLQNIQTSRSGVDQATEALRLARLRFQAGVGTQSDVTSAEADLTQAQGNLLAATLDYNRALATLQRAVGYTVAPAPPPPS
jgi:outer membrane protein TolC